MRGLAASGSGAEELKRTHCVLFELLHFLEANPPIFRHAQPRKHPAYAHALATARHRGSCIQHDFGIRVLPKEFTEVWQVVLEVQEVGLHLRLSAVVW